MGEPGRCTLMVGEKIEGSDGRDFWREFNVGIVRRKAAVLDDGVHGLVGGTTNSPEDNRLTELGWVFAREAAVGVLYRALLLDDVDEANAAELDGWERPVSIREDNEALRESLRCVAGEGAGLSPGWDF
jgi:hypothetical protein